MELYKNLKKTGVKTGTKMKEIVEQMMQLLKGAKR